MVRGFSAFFDRTPQAPVEIRRFPYYFQVNQTPYGYGVNIYRTAVPVVPGDEKALPEGDGPLDGANLVGGLSREAAGPAGAFLGGEMSGEGFELIPGTTAFKRDQGTSVRWQKGNWVFEYVGPAGPDQNPVALHHLQDLARLWPEKGIGLAGEGKVKVVLGNRLLTFAVWEKDGIRYSIQTRGTAEEFMAILDASGEWIKVLK